MITPGTALPPQSPTCPSHSDVNSNLQQQQQQQQQTTTEANSQMGNGQRKRIQLCLVIDATSNLRPHMAAAMRKRFLDLIILSAATVTSPSAVNDGDSGDDSGDSDVSMAFEKTYSGNDEDEFGIVLFQDYQPATGAQFLVRCRPFASYQSSSLIARSREGQSPFWWEWVRNMMISTTEEYDTDAETAPPGAGVGNDDQRTSSSLPSTSSRPSLHTLFRGGGGIETAVSEGLASALCDMNWDPQADKRCLLLCVKHHDAASRPCMQPGPCFMMGAERIVGEMARKGVMLSIAAPFTHAKLEKLFQCGAVKDAPEKTIQMGYGILYLRGFVLPSSSTKATAEITTTKSAKPPAKKPRLQHPEVNVEPLPVTENLAESAGSRGVVQLTQRRSVFGGSAVQASSSSDTATAKDREPESQKKTIVAYAFSQPDRTWSCNVLVSGQMHRASMYLMSPTMTSVLIPAMRDRWPETINLSNDSDRTGSATTVEWIESSVIRQCLKIERQFFQTTVLWEVDTDIENIGDASSDSGKDALRQLLLKMVQEKRCAALSLSPAESTGSSGTALPDSITLCVMPLELIHEIQHAVHLKLERAVREYKNDNPSSQISLPSLPLMMSCVIPTTILRQVRVLLQKQRQAQIEQQQQQLQQLQQQQANRSANVVSPLGMSAGSHHRIAAQMATAAATNAMKHQQQSQKQPRPQQQPTLMPPSWVIQHMEKQGLLPQQQQQQTQQPPPQQQQEHLNRMTPQQLFYLMQAAHNNTLNMAALTAMTAEGQQQQQQPLYTDRSSPPISSIQQLAQQLPQQQPQPQPQQQQQQHPFPQPQNPQQLQQMIQMFLSQQQQRQKEDEGKQ